MTRRTDIPSTMIIGTAPLRARINELTDSLRQHGAALSKIDYACGPPNETELSQHDVDPDPEATAERIVEWVKRLEAERDGLKADAARYQRLCEAALQNLNRPSGELRKEL